VVCGAVSVRCALGAACSVQCTAQEQHEFELRGAARGARAGGGGDPDSLKHLPQVVGLATGYRSLRHYVGVGRRPVTFALLCFRGGSLLGSCYRPRLYSLVGAVGAPGPLSQSRETQQVSNCPYHSS
jgi:hypothetical protein